MCAMNPLERISHLVVDVDGTLTDGSIYYDSHGNEVKKFNTRDGAGFLAAQAAGLTLVVVTGRACPAVARRMEEFQVAVLAQGVKDKAAWLGAWQQQQGLTAEHVAFIGDDLNDMAAMRLCAFCACPADACPEVRQEAHYISPLPGGAGVLRDVVFQLLSARGQWLETVRRVYGF